MSEKKEKTRRRILESAGSSLKESGISGTSVAGVMDGAGMTVGGFYAHFESKQEMVTEALASSLGEALDTLVAGLDEKSGREWISAVAGRYLSEAHRDSPTLGCPLPATAGEIARAGQDARDALASAIDPLVSKVAVKLEGACEGDPRKEALAVLSLLVGGLTLSRALADTPLSDEVLVSCLEHVDRC